MSHGIIDAQEEISWIMVDETVVLLCTYDRLGLHPVVIHLFGTSVSSLDSLSSSRPHLSCALVSGTTDRFLCSDK